MRDVIVTYRRAFVVLVHAALWATALVTSFLLRFDFQVPETYWEKVPLWLLALVAVRGVVHYGFGLFHGLWRYTGSRDLLTLVKAGGLSSVAFVVLLHFVGPAGFPRSIIIIDLLASIALVGGLRFGIRAVREIAVSNAAQLDGRRRLLIVGAGDAGEMLVREIRSKLGNRYEPVGFVDDNPLKIGEHIHGVRVLGSTQDVSALVGTHKVDEIIVAVPSATGREMRELVNRCSTTGATIRTIPGVEGLIDGRVTVNQIRNVAIEDLLGREPVKLDATAISTVIEGATVLVSGAGGSIGSELCRQVCHFRPGRLVLVERAENNLFEIHRALREANPGVDVVPYVADICDASRVQAILERERPSLILHAAAHKHVPMMESNPGEAIKNNVLGTKTLADAAVVHKVERFVMVSTDKAVNPTSVMGVSKRVAELYVQALSHRTDTHFITVRFGNVLGSAGSVVPIFKQQIEKGGPVLVTHPDMVRYFMTIPEASQLILQAASMGEGGEIFILDMGEPVKIVDLARALITLSGLRPDEDIEIRFTGVRPGEKLFEELALDDEHADKTRHPKIFVGRTRRARLEVVEGHIDQLATLANDGSPQAIKMAFKAAVPEYHGPSSEDRIALSSDAPPDSGQHDQVALPVALVH